MNTQNVKWIQKYKIVWFFLEQDANESNKRKKLPTDDNSYRESVANIANQNYKSSHFDLDNHEPIYQPEDPGESGENAEEPVTLHEEL